MTKRGNFWVRQVPDFKAKFNNNFISLLVKSPTLLYVGTYSTYGETDNVYRGQIVYDKGQIVYDKGQMVYYKEQIVYDKGQIVYIKVCYQPYEIVTQQFFTHPPLSICHYFSHCRNCDSGTPPTHPLVQFHYFFSLFFEGFPKAKCR